MILRIYLKYRNLPLLKASEVANVVNDAMQI